MKKRTRYEVAYQVEGVFKTRSFKTLKRLKGWARNIKVINLAIWKVQEIGETTSILRVYRESIKEIGLRRLNKIKL